MKFKPTSIPGLTVIEPEVFGDARGGFFEQYRQNVFKTNGISDDFVQENRSYSVKGVLRGLHYQLAPKVQAKLVYVTQGEVFDVALDLRKTSPTFGRFFCTVLSQTNRQMLYIPQGFAHGFLVLSERAEFVYKCSDYYSPEHERGVLWNDPALGIAWPAAPADVILSEKDKRHPVLSQADLF